MQATSPQVAFHGATVAVTVLMAGVHRAKWESLQASEASSDNARSRMRQRRFDVLPIENGGRIRSFYRTARWNDYHEIMEERLGHKDVLYQGTPVRDAIKGMASEKRFFYFLVEGSNVVGLFSLVHLSRRPVKLFLYGLVSELETRLADLVTARVSEEEVLAMTLAVSGKDKHKEVKERFLEDRGKGLELPVAEYLYLSDLVNVAQRQKLFHELRYSGKAFKDTFGAITRFRDAVAHPTRTLLRDERGVNDLWCHIDRIEDALFRLREASPPGEPDRQARGLPGSLAR